MRGISAVIAVVLILMITVALASAAYVWFTAVFKTTAGAGGAEAERLTTTGKSLMKVEGKTDKIYIRNIGDTNLSGFAVYMNDIPIDYEIDKETLAPGQVAGIIPDLAYYTEGSKVKITTAQGLISESAYEISFYGEEYSIDTAEKKTIPLDGETFDNFVFEAKVKMDGPTAEGSYEGVGIRIGSGYYIKYDGTIHLEKEGYGEINSTIVGLPLTDWITIKIIAGPIIIDPIEGDTTNIQIYVNGILFINHTDEEQSIPARCSCRLCLVDPLTGRCINCPCDVGCICPTCESCSLGEPILYPIYTSGYISLGASAANVSFSDVKVMRT